jgi:hypothetical protein
MSEITEDKMIEMMDNKDFYCSEEFVSVRAINSENQLVLVFAMSNIHQSLFTIIEKAELKKLVKDINQFLKESE